MKNWRDIQSADEMTPPGGKPKCCPCPDCDGNMTYECPHKEEWEIALRRAKIGEAWETDSSLEKWFPITAEELDQLRLQLAGCSVAALDGSESQEAKPHSYGWSPAYADVLKLRREYEQVRRELSDTREHWLTMAKDYRSRAEEWASGDTMHTQRLAEAKSLENCAYALAVALQTNAPDQRPGTQHATKNTSSGIAGFAASNCWAKT